jgi:hypothetical protein
MDKEHRTTMRIHALPPQHNLHPKHKQLTFFPRLGLNVQHRFFLVQYIFQDQSCCFRPLMYVNLQRIHSNLHFHVL